MKKIKMMLLLALCTAAFTVVPVSAEEGSILLGGDIKQTGEVLDVTVTLEQGGVNSGKVTMEYDPAAVTLVSADYGEKTRDAAAKSLNTSEEGKLTTGFADLERIELGEVLDAEFTAKTEEPEGGYVFHVTASEWSDGEKNSAMEDLEYEAFDLIIKDNQVTLVPTEKQDEPENPDNTPSPQNPGTTTEPGGQTPGGQTPGGGNGSGGGANPPAGTAAGVGANTADSTPLTATVSALLLSFAALAGALCLRKRSRS